MAKKRIVSVGFELANDEVTTIDFRSNASLLDWDVILFREDVLHFLHSGYASDSYQGKPSLSESKSFQLREAVQHWHREISEAVNCCKTVFYFLEQYRDFYIDTGKREYSGTGRNQKTTRMVSLYDNYKCLPLDVSVTPRQGKEMMLAPKGAEVISTFWQEFSALSEYKVTLESDQTKPLLYTKHGNNEVGSYVTTKSGGALILLPYMDLEDEDFTDEVEHDDEWETCWSEKGIQFGAKLVASLIGVDTQLRKSSEKTVEPDWAKSDEYVFTKETELRQEVQVLNEQIAQLDEEKSQCLAELEGAGALRGLLYETGKALEASILVGLNILGFQAENYEDDTKEFDVVFESSEGRLIGEAEGKDNKAINITKLRQLALNLHEDLERDEVSSPAKGVLFGNAYRLKPLNERQQPFTDKCLLSSNTSSTALVHTPDLFSVVHYVSETNDLIFAESCRKALIETVGLVKFPAIPEAMSETSPEETAT
ncbi:hypothetical protein [Vibrio parahaemolyticus]|uniref:hypothetical protein n=1 Tax=Vibrio parahaemolyticus TaxID=670 RepID=UPI00226AC52A|nr:hypothetical protein [Vibrio parahaemolyticus]MCX8895639.1 hypothetical protein [Vibrio parahaemolyticus]HCE3247881.1 hypothetical protein [Vibrio parahaemolyticus]